MLKSDHRELRNSKGKLMWVVVGGWVVVVGVQCENQYCSGSALALALARS